MFKASGFQPWAYPFCHISSLIVDLNFFKKGTHVFLLHNKLTDIAFNSVSDLNRERDLILLVVLFVLCSLGLTAKNSFLATEWASRVSKKVWKVNTKNEGYILHNFSINSNWKNPTGRKLKGINRIERKLQTFPWTRICWNDFCPCFSFPHGS